MKHCALLALVTFASSSCNTGDTIRRDDHGDIYPTLRLLHPVQEPDSPEQSPPAEFELQVTGADDSADDLDYELLQITGGLRWNLVHDDKVTFGLSAGLAYERDSFELDSIIPLDTVETHFGIALGARLGYRIFPRVELYARGQTAQYIVAPGNSNQIEAGVDVRLTDAPSAFVAWQRWDVYSDEVSDLQVDKIDLDTDGIAFGLSFSF